MAIILSLLSSLMWGASDFSGGLMSKRYPAMVVVAWSSTFGLLMASVAVALTTGGNVNRRVRTAKELEELERQNIIAALESADWKIAGANGAAQLLGMKPTTLSSRMKALGIERR